MISECPSFAGDAGTSTVCPAKACLPYAGRLKHYLQRTFPNLPDPDDIVQEAYLKLLRSGPVLELPYPQALLFQVARRVALDQLRRRQHSPFVKTNPEAEPGSEAPDAGMQVSQRQERELLHQAIIALPARERAALALRWLGGLTTREAADRMEITPSTLEKHAARAIRRCAGFLHERGLPVARKYLEPIRQTQPKAGLPPERAAA